MRLRVPRAMFALPRLWSLSAPVWRSAVVCWWCDAGARKRAAYRPLFLDRVYRSRGCLSRTRAHKREKRGTREKERERKIDYNTRRVESVEIDRITCECVCVCTYIYMRDRTGWRRMSGLYRINMLRVDYEIV